MRVLPSITSIIPIWGLMTLAQAEVDFATEVRPLLNAHCVSCHGGVKEAGGVSFIYREKALGKGKSGLPVIVPHRPEASEMLVRVLSQDPDEVMPQPSHGPPLSPREIDVLRRWVAQGAPWGEHWAFEKPQLHPNPQVSHPDWPRRDLDTFLLARLDQEDLTPSPEASPAALLRRLTLDLTGLPPTLEELEAFLADDSPGAYDRQVERLLASERFGERWASVWMDLARYADSEGLGLDRRRQVWKYRDWLIGAFNRDLPYDQFTIEQLAGDLLPAASLEQHIATTFHRLSQGNDEGGTDDEEFRVAAIMDRVAVTWEVWQGVTMGCVQCHAHPYDPIEHEDYFKFMDFFNSTVDADLPGEEPRLSVPLDPAHYARSGELHDLIRAAEAQSHHLFLGTEHRTDWRPSRAMTASSSKAELQVKTQDGFEEYRAAGNVAAGAIHTLEFSMPAEQATLTALRLEIHPENPATASHTPEWGAVFRRIQLHLLEPGKEPRDIALAEVIGDEAHPLIDPNDSLREGETGWGAFTKISHARHAVILPQSPLKLPAGSRLRLTLAHTSRSAGGSFPLISRRGRVAGSDHEVWTQLLHDAERQGLKQEIRAAKAELAAIPSTTTLVMRELEAHHRRPTHLFERGNWLEKGKRITHADTPASFPPLPASEETPNRLDMARWLVSPENPLTARVAVNRFWLELFGTGLVATPEDFGSSGEAPTHPELLDTLAVRFQTEMNWSIKTLLRELVTSAAYRQEAKVTPELVERDADNRLLARGPRQRLTGEMIRDTALTVSGLSVNRVGGPPVFPPIPKGVWTPFVGDPWKTPQAGEPDRYRRSVYTYWKRSIPYPLFATFDAPTRELCSNRRTISNTPLQALTLLNDDAFQECADALAHRMQHEFSGDIGQKIATAYRAATSRVLTADRADELLQLYETLHRQYSLESSSLPEKADDTNQPHPERAALTIVATILLNLDESLIR